MIWYLIRIYSERGIEIRKKFKTQISIIFTKIEHALNNIPYRLALGKKCIENFFQAML